MKGRYIVLEGIQGSGKTDQIKRIAEWLRGQGIAVHTTREPGGGDVTARTLRIITQNPAYNLTTKTEVLIYNAARAQSLEVIRNVLARGVWVICDRSYLTTLAIQYYARGDVKNYDDINKICEFAVGDMWPDLTLVLDVPAEVSKKRASARYRGERFDTLDLDFLQRIRKGYLTEAKKRKLTVIDGTQTQASVFEAVSGHIKPLLSQMMGALPAAGRRPDK